MSGKKLRSCIPYEKELLVKARELRNRSTSAEILFWKALKRMPFYQEISFNRQKPLGKYIVDFYCHKLGLVVEIDGGSHGSPEAIAKDEKRSKWLEVQGLTVIRFVNREVLENIAGVMTVVERFIEKKLRKNPPSPLCKGEGGIRVWVG